MEVPVVASDRGVEKCMLECQRHVELVTDAGTGDRFFYNKKLFNRSDKIMAPPDGETWEYHHDERGYGILSSRSEAHWVPRELE